MPPRSAGLALLKDGRTRILLAHPTRAPWWGAWSIPKGVREPGESDLDAAIRETREEVGLAVDPAWIEPTPREVPYVDRRGRVTKIVVWFACDVPEAPDVIPAARLQREEVDHARFMDRAEAERRILRRLLPVLGLLNG
ncbi:MAG: NUDIX domain-containing protein [Myxococcota bacterium]